MKQDRVSSKTTFSRPTKPLLRKKPSVPVPPPPAGASLANKPQGIKQQIPMERLVQQISAIVFSNVKVYLEDRLSFVDRLASEIEDVKFNITTLSSILHSRKLFSEEEYKTLHQEVVKSFGVVDSHGQMEGKVFVTKYNFPSER